MIQPPKRLQSIDVLRAITMFFMIFVNDVDGVSNIPSWIKHVSEHADGLGFADTIFPTFLFIVGLSIPFALQKRLQAGEDKSSIASHILLRSLALIVMGFFHVNLEHYSNTALLPEAVFEIIITLAFFLIWLDYKPEYNKRYQYILQAIGILILIVMAFLYKGENHQIVIGLRPYWWGILGLIGWGYLTCALIYLITNGKFNMLVTALIILLAINITTHAIHNKHLNQIYMYKWFASNCSMCCFIMTGIVISLFYTRFKQSGSVLRFLKWLMVIAGAFILFGFITRPIAGINKDHDTPAWIDICLGIGIAVFALLIFMVDIKGKAYWFNIIKPAGTSTLTCYLIPYLLYSLMNICGFDYPEFFNQGIGGIIRSFAVAFIVIFIGGFLEKKQLRLKI